MKQRLKMMITLLGLSIGFVMFGAAHAAQAATYTVDTTADDAALTACTAATNDCSLRGAINNANSLAGADTINFDPAVFGSAQTITLVGSSELSISGDLTISGTGAGSLTVKGNIGYAIPIFDISGGIVGINNLKLTGGNGESINNSQYGGAIYISGGTVTISDTTLSNNSASYGAAIAVNGGSLTVSRSSISSNTARIEGGGIYVLSGSLAVTSSTVSGNTASSGGGIKNSGGTVTISDSTVSGNTANNTTTVGEGGGIFNVSGALTVTNSTVSGNTAMGNCTMGGSGCGYRDGGGGIYSYAALTIANSTITANDAQTGGGIYIWGALNLSNSIVAGNASGGNIKGDIYDRNNSVISGDYNLVQNASGATFSGTHNITGQDPKLGALAYNGGTTQTHALLLGSPAIDAGDPTFNATNTPYDQRGAGFPRVQNGRIDIGAFESDTFQSGSSFIVNTLADHDDGDCGTTDCTLREAVKYAPAGANITFNLTGTITLTGGDLLINKNLTINGPTSAPGITISGNNASRIFTVTAGTLNLSTLTLSGGNGIGGGTNSGNGGAIAIDPGAAATVTNSTFSGNNSTSNGGAIRNGGTLTVTNSTFSGNTAGGTGGAIRNNGTLTVTSSTISGNTASNIGSGGTTTTGSGGGIYNNSTLNLSNSIVAGNSAAISSPDIYGTVTSGDYNLVQNTSGATLSGTHNITGQPALLGLLENNGGPTQTHALLFGSPAIDQGNATGTDQRGLTRPVDNPSISNAAGGNGADIGASEMQLAPTAAAVSISGRVLTISGRGIRNVRLSLTDSSGQVRTAATTAFGYYRFGDVQVGETYILSAFGKHYTFSQPLQVLNINEETNEVNFIADSEKRIRVF